MTLRDNVSDGVWTVVAGETNAEALPVIQAVPMANEERRLTMVAVFGAVSRQQQR